MDELDEIAQLEAASEKLMNEPAASVTRRRARSSASLGHSSGAQTPGANLTGELSEIRTRLKSFFAIVEDLAQRLPENTGSPTVSAGDDAEAVVEEEITARPDGDTEPPETPEDVDDLRSVFPIEEDMAAAGIDEAAIVASVEERVTRHALYHHSSVVVLIGWAFAVLSAGIGMAWGYISASGRYPFWWTSPHAGLFKALAAEYLSAPVGVVLLPIAGYILWRIGKEAIGEKGQAALEVLAIVLFLAGILLPAISLV